MTGRLKNSTWSNQLKRIFDKLPVTHEMSYPDHHQEQFKFRATEVLVANDGKGASGESNHARPYRESPTHHQRNMVAAFDPEYRCDAGVLEQGKRLARIISPGSRSQRS